MKARQRVKKSVQVRNIERSRNKKIMIIGLLGIVIMALSALGPAILFTPPDVQQQTQQDLSQIPLDLQIPETEANPDIDNDGLTNELELLIGTNPAVPTTKADALDTLDQKFIRDEIAEDIYKENRELIESSLE